MKFSPSNRSSLFTTIAFMSTAIMGTAASQPSFADDLRNIKNPATTPAAAPSGTPGAAADADVDSEAERVNVDTIKEKYWARGDQSELGVVQNRAYTKAHKWEFGLFRCDRFDRSFSLGL